ncbi:hypothetical protein ABPG73_004648 [Tetrahymena malaccensis]
MGGLMKKQKQIKNQTEFLNLDEFLNSNLSSHTNLKIRPFQIGEDGINKVNNLTSALAMCCNVTNLTLALSQQDIKNAL